VAVRTAVAVEACSSTSPQPSISAVELPAKGSADRGEVIMKARSL
jgi:hypothetical protein